MLLPVQRIPRYRLLLQDFLKATPIDHPDHSQVRDALSLISQIADFVNETIRDHQKIEKMVQIQTSLVGLNESLFVPGRQFIKMGRVQKVI